MQEPISKSQKKREADRLKKIGVELIALPANKLDSLSLPTNLRQAIVDAKAIKSHGAMRRQAQLIGKLMRAADNEAILVAYEELMAEGSAKTALFHELEQWRDRLINDSKEALTDFIDAYPEANVQQLRQLVKKAIDEKTTDTHVGASKALFRFLKACSE
jgi:ribosome-associated protein